MTTKVYKYALKNIIPYIRFTTYYTSLRGWKYHKMYEVLREGDIILTIDKKKLTSLLIPGNFSHAGMCVSKDGFFEVAEMTHSDYTKSCFFDLCKESDRVVVLRVIEATQEEIEAAIDKCREFEKSKYDLAFSLGVEALYCSELCLESWGNEKIKANLADLAGLGKEYISPDGLYSAEGLKVIIDSSDLKYFI